MKTIGRLDLGDDGGRSITIVQGDPSAVAADAIACPLDKRNRVFGFDTCPDAQEKLQDVRNMHKVVVEDESVIVPSDEEIEADRVIFCAAYKLRPPDHLTPGRSDSHNTALAAARDHGLTSVIFWSMADGYKNTAVATVAIAAFFTCSEFLVWNHPPLHIYIVVGSPEEEKEYVECARKWHDGQSWHWRQG